MSDIVCPYCDGEQSSYQFTAGEIGGEVRRCIECESRFWWDGEESHKTRETSRVTGGNDRHVDRDTEQ